jgi:predicted metal-dependent hydrolase
MGRQVTPSDLTITPRDRRFGRGERTDRWWLNGNPYGSALYDALSITFPKGEAFFVESVRAFRDGAPARLAEEIRAFITQEVMHSREHVAFNKRAVEAGYDVTPLEARVDMRLEETKTRPPIINLAATMALEHFTAVIAHQLLGNPRHLSSSSAPRAP